MIDRLEDLNDLADYWSVSKLQAIQQCGRLFKYRYIDHVPEEKTAILKFGSAVHKSIEIMHTNAVWEDGDIQRLWADTWTPYVATIDWDKEQVSSNVHKNRGVKMLLLYRDTNKDDDVVALEKKFRIKSSETLPAFGGRLDKVVRRGPVMRVVDFKTARTAPDSLVLAADPQLTMYYMACKELGYDVQDFAIHSLQDGKEYWTKRSDTDVEILLESIQEAQAKTLNKMFARSISFLCRGCVFKEHCLGNIQSTSRILPATD